MRDARGELSDARDLLEACLLFLLWERPAYGYDLLSRLGWYGFDGFVPGLIYDTLCRLHRAGLVETTWKPSVPAGSSRRVYALTAAGEKKLARSAEAAVGFKSALDEFLSRYERVAVP
jgi:PadR family transcriptional regulator PadR